MLISRRSFLGSILALGAAPAIVRADSLMRVVPVETRIVTLEGMPWWQWRSQPHLWQHADGSWVSFTDDVDRVMRELWQQQQRRR